MSLLWPGFLLLLGLIPTIVGAYLWMLRRRRRFTIRYSSLSLVREAAPHPSRLRRHLPFALFVSALASLVTALSRPAALVEVPVGQATVILTIDVSRSMCSTDIRPNRLEAAKDAAQDFVNRQKPGLQIGIVAFAGYAVLIQPPTTDKEALQIAIESLNTARRTAIGSGILESIDAIAEINKNVPPTAPRASSQNQPTPVPAGTYVPDIIVLLTDGVSNVGPDPLEAAQFAADRGIRIYPIGYGTDDGSFMDCGGRFGGFESFGGGQGSGGGQWLGGGFRRGLDERTLKMVADMTGGKYYSATSASELQQVFQSLPSYLITRQETQEISYAFTAAAAFLTTLAIGLAILWRPLP